MFEPQDTPRLFGLPPGADFAAELVAGLESRMQDRAPEDWGRVRLIVNSARMQAAVMARLADGPLRILPRVELITDLGADAVMAGLPQPAHPLGRRLELAQLTARLLETSPDLAAQSAAYDLADSLAALMSEMQAEGVGPGALRNLDISDQSGHWQRALAFIDLVQRYFQPGATPDPDARQRQLVEGLIRRWAATPPSDPILIAGSTGSRGTTSLLMQAVARLPQGAVILPGFDFEMGPDLWDGLAHDTGAEDHPQYRFADLARALDMPPRSVARWTETDPVPARRALVSMALRPAPVTDGWLRDGPGLGDLMVASQGLGLLEAPDPRTESLAIALRLRAAVDAGQTVALITPDRTLARQVTAALDRWGITPDDSAGQPLSLSAPGRLLRHTAGLLGRAATPETLLTVLKHPLVHTGADRGPHLRRTRELELWLRRAGPPHPTADDLRQWAETAGIEGAEAWLDWICDTVLAAEDCTTGPLADMVAYHVALTEALARGPAGASTGELWQETAGEAALAEIGTLSEQAAAGGEMTLANYRALIDAILRARPVRDAVTADPRVLIWGTLEARVQGADVVVLGGLNEGTWPEPPGPDPWLNRRMRAELGLLSPERSIGLSAHDFQQAVCGREVLMTRATRDAEAETVMSRWLNRVLNLMAGLPGTGGPDAVSQMRGRGRIWLGHARAMEARVTRVPTAPRPAPCPPAAARPTRLSVTDIQKLVRDPYAIYASRVLRLRALDPLRKDPDARLRGTATHAIFEDYVQTVAPDDPDAAAKLVDLARAHLETEVPWVATRLNWLTRLEQVAPWFVDADAAHRAVARPAGLEIRGEWRVPGTDVTLRGTADRIDLHEDGTLVVLDYKTGTAPTDKQIRHYDPQVLIEAAMAEAGAFTDLPAREVSHAGHVQLGSPAKWRLFPLRWDDPKEKQVRLDPDEATQMLQRLLQAYADPDKGFQSRRAMETMGYAFDFDHLARYGEWDISDPATPEKLT